MQRAAELAPDDAFYEASHAFLEDAHGRPPAHHRARLTARTPCCPARRPSSLPRATCSGAAIAAGTSRPCISGWRASGCRDSMTPDGISTSITSQRGKPWCSSRRTAGSLPRALSARSPGTR